MGPGVCNPGYMQARGAKVSEELYIICTGENEGQGDRVLSVQSLLRSLHLQSVYTEAFRDSLANPPHRLYSLQSSDQHCHRILSAPLTVQLLSLLWSSSSLGV